jgi:hypothetical protein
MPICRSLEVSGRDVVASWSLIAPGGSASFELPLALDEAPGKYEMEGQDTASGLTAIHPFRVAQDGHRDSD